MIAIISEQNVLDYQSLHRLSNKLHVSPLRLHIYREPNYFFGSCIYEIRCALSLINFEHGVDTEQVS